MQQALEDQGTRSLTQSPQPGVILLPLGTSDHTWGQKWWSRLESPFYGAQRPRMPLQSDPGSMSPVGDIEGCWGDPNILLLTFELVSQLIPSSEGQWLP